MTVSVMVLLVVRNDEESLAAVATFRDKRGKQQCTGVGGRGSPCHRRSTASEHSRGPVHIVVTLSGKTAANAELNTTVQVRVMTSTALVVMGLTGSLVAFTEVGFGTNRV